MIASREQRAPGFFSGVLAAGMVAVALTAILYFGWAVMGLPFVPFDFFDAMTQALPGRVIAFGINSMVSVIRALNVGPTSQVAKLAEQSMAIIGFVLAAIIAGSILFCLVRGCARRRR